MKTNSLTVEKQINTNPERLFKAWITVKDFARWFLPGAIVNVEEVVLDARPGGKFRIDMNVEGILRPHEGEYKIVDVPTKLVFTWKSFMTNDKDSLVTVHFVPNDGGTLIKLIHEQLPEEEFKIQAHTEGWTHILDGLKDWILETTTNKK